MRGSSIIHSIGLAIITAFVTLSVGASIIHAEQQETPQQPQDPSAGYLKADAACKTLGADHAFRVSEYLSVDRVPGGHLSVGVSLGPLVPTELYSLRHESNHELGWQAGVSY
jgi:hypothetical protein